MLSSYLPNSWKSWCTLWFQYPQTHYSIHDHSIPRYYMTSVYPTPHHGDLGDVERGEAVHVLLLHARACNDFRLICYFQVSYFAVSRCSIILCCFWDIAKAVVQLEQLFLSDQTHFVKHNRQMFNSAPSFLHNWQIDIDSLQYYLPAARGFPFRNHSTFRDGSLIGTSFASRWRLLPSKSSWIREMDLNFEFGAKLSYLRAKFGEEVGQVNVLLTAWKILILSSYSPNVDFII